ncbi:MAG: hypothetical protein HC849_02225 [Oscillatoriales cyanobacterium RU_3_3]|nr:hypothetical protein [Oscillatoriales cyanobacterium RU_3_3]NJR22013.1 hypothetical protein [Richelia sp. CSU_2_1]
MKVIIEEFHRAIVQFNNLTIGNFFNLQLKPTVTFLTDAIALTPQTPQTSRNQAPSPAQKQPIQKLSTRSSIAFPLFLLSSSFFPHPSSFFLLPSSFTNNGKKCPTGP